MADKIKMSEIRAQFPMYADVPDDQLLMGLRKKFYSDIAPGDFYNRIDRDTEREARQKEILDEMGWGGQFAAGLSRVPAVLGRTIKRLTPGNGYTAEKAAEEGKYDEALLNTSGGFWGNLAGEAAFTAAPGGLAAKGLTTAARVGTSVLPRALAATGAAAAPYIGAAGSGALVGGALSPEDMGKGAKWGAALGAGGELAGRVLAAGYTGAKGVIEPLYEKGRERILKRTLERYAADPKAVKAALANTAAYELVPGAGGTLAEVTLDPGLIQLQRGAQASSPEVASALEAANLKRVDAYRSALGDIAGTEAQRNAAQGLRRQAGQEAYGRAFDIPVDMANVAPEVAQRSQRLLARPSVQRAIPRAMEDAAEQGLAFDGTTSIRGLHQIKMALDNEIGEAAMAGKHTGSLEGTRDELLKLIDDLSGGAYDAARSQYAQLSRVPNQQAIAQELQTKGFPAIGEFGQSARTKPEAYAKALNEGLSTVRRATGMKNLPLEQAMEPAQLDTVQNIAKDMARNARVNEAARVPGSPTAQYMSAQNILRGFLGPMGLPESALDHAVGKIASGVLGWPYKMTEPQMQQMLAQALTDPAVAQRLLAAPDSRTVLEILQPYMAQTTIQLGAAQ